MFGGQYPKDSPLAATVIVGVEGATFKIIVLEAGMNVRDGVPKMPFPSSEGTAAALAKLGRAEDESPISEPSTVELAMMGESPKALSVGSAVTVEIGTMTEKGIVPDIEPSTPVALGAGANGSEATGERVAIGALGTNALDDSDPTETEIEGSLSVPITLSVGAAMVLGVPVNEKMGSDVEIDGEGKSVAIPPNEDDEAIPVAVASTAFTVTVNVATVTVTVSTETESVFVTEGSGKESVTGGVGSPNAEEIDGNASVLSIGEMGTATDEGASPNVMVGKTESVPKTADAESVSEATGCPKVIVAGKELEVSENCRPRMYCALAGDGAAAGAGLRIIGAGAA